MYDSQQTNGEMHPLWYSGLTTADRVSLAGTTIDAAQLDRVDVVVVGAGIAGLSTAYELCSRGRSVVVIERGLVGSGETGRSTAHLSNALDDRYYLLERLHGARGAQLAAESHTAAIARIEAIAAAENIDCDFTRVPGYLLSSRSGETALRELEHEQSAARRAGLPVELEPRGHHGFGAGGPCLRFEGQAELQPLQYLAGLVRAIARMGGHVLTRTRVVEVEPGRRAQRVRLMNGRCLAASAVVVATNTPINDVIAMHTKQAPYRTYALALEIPRGSIARALFWDTADPYHYVRLAGDGDVLVVGGEDHKVAQAEWPDHRWSRLEAWARKRFPMATAPLARWSGQIQEPADGLAFIGRSPGSEAPVYIATGDSGNGMTHGAIAGLLLADLISGQANPWAKLYEPARRVTTAGAGDFVRENMNAAVHFAQWFLPADRVTRGIEPGQGKVIRRGLRRIALYVDEAGHKHEFSASCSHLGCSVSWNRAERSWDCPCHGSRFDPYGRVMTGPAVRDLVPIEYVPAIDEAVPNPRRPAAAVRSK